MVLGNWRAFSLILPDPLCSIQLLCQRLPLSHLISRHKTRAKPNYLSVTEFSYRTEFRMELSPTRWLGRACRIIWPIDFNVRDFQSRMRLSCVSSMCLCLNYSQVLCSRIPVHCGVGALLAVRAFTLSKIILGCRSTSLGTLQAVSVFSRREAKRGPSSLRSIGMTTESEMTTRRRELPN
jgi:hypothetical protein